MSAEPGDRLYVWQERTEEGWGAIAAMVPQLGVTAILQARDRDIAERVFGPIARQRARTTRNPTRLARFELAATEETL